MRDFLAMTLCFFLAPAISSACSAIKDDTERLACYDARFTDIELIRCTDMYGIANCEIITPNVNDMVSCIAFDANNKAIAKAPAFGAAGLTFDGIEANAIDHVDCEQVM